jgi:2-keto-4-pentenoate hydratase
MMLIRYLAIWFGEASAQRPCLEHTPMPTTPRPDPAAPPTHAPTERAQVVARTIWDAWKSGERLRGDGLPAPIRPLSEAEGHAAQAQLGPLAGPQCGWKIAATSKPGQAHIGVSGPIAGRLFECFAYEDAATLVGVSHMRVVEAEIAFRLAYELNATEVLSEQEVLEAVEAIHLAIEIPDSRFERFETIGGAQLLADDACAGRFVVGPPIAAWSTIDLRVQRTAISVDGQRVAEGVGANVLDGPADALRWLANDLRGRGELLAAGDLVLTGTTTVPAVIAPGSRVVAHFDGLGEVRVDFES